MQFDPNEFPESPPAPALTGEASHLSEGAKQFIKQFVPTDDDSGCIGTFEHLSEHKPFRSREESEKQGRPVEIYEPRLYVRIKIRGNDKLEVHRPATEADKRRFPFSWQEFQKGEQAAVRGTHLNKLPGMDSGLILGFHARNVFTIEDLALVSDTNLPNLGTGARELRRAAMEYVESHKFAASSVAQLQEANDAVAQMRETVNAQSAQLAQALALLEKQSAENAKLAAQVAEKPARKKPGRPPKTAEPPAE